MAEGIIRDEGVARLGRGRHAAAPEDGCIRPRGGDVESVENVDEPVEVAFVSVKAFEAKSNASAIHRHVE